MLIFSAKLTKRHLFLGGGAVLLAAVVLLAVLLPRGEEAPPEAIPGGTDRERVSYLASLGWQASPTPSETLEFTLPDPLGETYERYNQLQLSQGFDLTAFAGRQVKRFTYPVSNHPKSSTAVQADLYVCDGVIIGGDILCAGPDSFVATLEFPGP